MPETLTVALNRESPREVTPEAASIETDRSFSLAFENHGGPAHVHLHVDDALAAVARPSATHVYVEGGATRHVEVALRPDHDPVKGYVDVSTGYGAKRSRVNVTVTNPRKDGGPDVAVDDSLAEKRPAADGAAASSSGTAANARPLAVAGVGVVAAAGVALSVSESLGLVVGALAVLCGVAAAAHVLEQA